MDNGAVHPHPQIFCFLLSTGILTQTIGEVNLAKAKPLTKPTHDLLLRNLLSFFHTE